MSIPDEIRDLEFRKFGDADGKVAVRVIYEDFDLVNNPQTDYEITNPDGQPESETKTLSDGRVFKRTYTYTDVSGMRIQTRKSPWVKI